MTNATPYLRRAALLLGLLTPLAHHATAQTALGEALTPNGRLRAGTTGSFDTHGYHLSTGNDGQPAFLPNAVDDSQWADGFGIGNVPGNVTALAVAANGDIIVGGRFFDAGGNPGADCIARWNGSAWLSLGGGLSNEVDAILVMPNGDIVVGGSFGAVPNVPNTQFLARWNGTAWNALGTGVNSSVSALALGPGSSVYVGGAFQDAGGNPDADRIARWDGTAWRNLGTGITSSVSTVYAIQATRLGDVVVGGSFSNAGGNTNADKIARWDGTAWQAYGTGLGGEVRALTTTATNQVVAGGSFTSAGGSTATSYIARWDGTAWQAVGTGLNGAVYSFAQTVGGDIVAGGDFTNAGGNPDADNIARFDGTIWRNYGPAYPIRVLAIAETQNGGIVAGGQGTGGSTNPEHVRLWTGVAWQNLIDRNQHGLNNTVYAVAVAANGDLLAGGAFTNAEGDATISHIARWNGSRWVSVGGGLDGDVNDILVAPNGDIIAAGKFYNAGGTPGATFIARWDGTAWQNYGSGPPIYANAVALMPNGDVYAGGQYTGSGGNGYLSRWDGTGWRNITTTLSGPISTAGGAVRALAVAPNGTLIVGGGFLSAGAAGTSFLARYNGTTWSSLGAVSSASQSNVGVYSLAYAPNGDLIIGGSFASAGGATGTANLARYNGTTWSGFGTGVNDYVRAVAAAPNGDIYAGGNFTETTPTYPNRQRIARWDGSAWQRVGSGLDASVQALAVAPNGSVLAGGYFAAVGDGSKSSSYFGLFRPGTTSATHSAVAAEALRLFPNPAHNMATLLLPADAAGQSVRLLDALGREVRRQAVAARATEATVDLTGLASGLYFVRCGAAMGRLVVE